MTGQSDLNYYDVYITCIYAVFSRKEQRIFLTKHILGSKYSTINLCYM